MASRLQTALLVRAFLYTAMAWAILSATASAQETAEPVACRSRGLFHYALLSAPEGTRVVGVDNSPEIGSTDQHSSYWRRVDRDSRSDLILRHEERNYFSIFLSCAKGDLVLVFQDYGERGGALLASPDMSRSGRILFVTDHTLGLEQVSESHYQLGAFGYYLHKSIVWQCVVQTVDDGYCTHYKATTQTYQKPAGRVVAHPKVRRRTRAPAVSLFSDELARSISLLDGE